MALSNLSPKGLGTKALAALSFFKFAIPDTSESMVLETGAESIGSPGASLISEISFEPNSWNLTERAQDSLRRLVQDVLGPNRGHNQRHGRIDAIKIVSWSDIDSPAAARRKFTKRDFELAEKRSHIVAEFLLTDLQGAETELFNMATTKPDLARLMKSTDTRIRRALELAGISMTGHRISCSHKASRSLVIVTLNEEIRLSEPTNPVAS